VSTIKSNRAIDQIAGTKRRQREVMADRFHPRSIMLIFPIRSKIVLSY
jgi:hypothetical protein